MNWFDLDSAYSLPMAHICISHYDIENCPLLGKLSLQRITPPFDDLQKFIDVMVGKTYTGAQLIAVNFDPVCGEFILTCVHRNFPFVPSYATVPRWPLVRLHEGDGIDAFHVMIPPKIVPTIDAVK